jgi:acetyl/propionyl-CoA carboxylase alpha subunit
MVKAVAGGGGLRPVTREAELAGAMHRCAAEATAAFGDGRVYVERLLTRARHVEVQVIGDGTGAVAILGDRDCSLQRRRQKLVEIAPAAIGGALRARLSEAAAALIASARYAGLAKVITGGGTLEEAARRAARALAEFDIAGVPTNVALLQALLRLPGLGTIEVGWVDAHAAELAADGAALSPAALSRVSLPRC